MVLRLEVFENETPTDIEGAGTIILDALAFEEAKLAAYESGYAAGWEDADAAQADESARLKAELARSMQSMSFTYHEARAHVLKAIEPLLGELVGRILPEIAREALAPIVLETLVPIAEELADLPAKLVVNPRSRAAVESLLAEATGLPVTIVEEPTLGEGQVYLELGDIEREVNLDRAVAAITEAVHGFFDLSGKD